MQDFNYIGPIIKIAAKCMEQHLNAKAEQIGLTSVQMRILHYICMNAGQGVCQRDIEERFELSHATVSGVVARLEAKDFVKSIASANDRRYKTVIATEKAQKCDGEMHAYIREIEQQAVKGISPEETQALYNVLNKILSNLGVENPFTSKKGENRT